MIKRQRWMQRLHALQNVFPVPLTWCFRKKYIFPAFPARIKKKALLSAFPTFPVLLLTF